MLQVNDLYKMQCQIYMYNTIKLNKYPLVKEKITENQSNHAYNTRYNVLRNIHCRINICKQSLLYNAIKTWNVLPEEVKNKSLKLFKSACKKIIIVQY